MQTPSFATDLVLVFSCLQKDRAAFFALQRNLTLARTTLHKTWMSSVQGDDGTPLALRLLQRGKRSFTQLTAGNSGYKHTRACCKLCKLTHDFPDRRRSPERHKSVLTPASNSADSKLKPLLHAQLPIFQWVRSVNGIM